ncbi:MAG: ABC transporter permease [Muribaculaceae bacterium]|nr:ABC transporter permease [Muribaculaceae bacterium]MDE6644183.1 ABC transporter permease [Muribaculaceae bacterium]
MKKFFHNIVNWPVSLVKVTYNEIKLVFTDEAVLLFFFFLPLIYPIIYTLIYNPEVPRDIPVAVVDNCRTTDSRELTRSIDATPEIKIIGYASSLDEAREWKNEKACYGILEIPADYSHKIGRGEQAHVQFYSDMSLLLRYRSFLNALTDVQLATGANIRQQLINDAGILADNISGSPIENQAIMLGDTEQGFASFVIPGIVILILQQSLVLGVTIMIGTSEDRRRRNRGRDPKAVNASISASILGKAFCYMFIYVPLVLYIIHFIPWMFNLPHIGDLRECFLFVMPLIVASIFFAMTVSYLVREREMSLMVVVFTSVVFLFLCGLTWPRYAMSQFWIWIGNAVPCVWGVEGFIRMNSNGASLQANSTEYLALWALAIIYLITAYLVEWNRRRRWGKVIKEDAPLDIEPSLESHADPDSDLNLTTELELPAPDPSEKN